MAARPPSSMRGRPPSSGMGVRPMGGRLGTGQVPGTGRPGTRGGQAGMTSTVLPAGIKVADRPMTQQGLSGMKTASKGPQRQIQDRTYWLGEIRTKTNELSAEIRKVETDVRQYQEENNTYLMFEKRAETLAAEIASLQGELHDYNMMIDQMNMNKDLTGINDDYNTLKSRNDREEDSLERIFEQRQTMEQQVSKLENEINHERTMTENRVQDMEPEMRERYGALKAESLRNADIVNNMQDEIESLNSKQQQIEQSLQSNPIKLEAVRLYEQMNELQEKHDQLQQEQETFSSPEAEKELLLTRVKSDNQEIASMERQSKELDERINIYQEELQQIESALEDQKDESSEKYRQLQKREQNINEFMSTYEENRSSEAEQISQLEQSNIALLEQISRDIVTSTNLPSVDEMRAMQEDLQFKEGELQKAQSTSTTLTGENVRLQQDLAKVEQLADKIDIEMISLREKNDQMVQDLKKFQDINQLHADAEQKKLELVEEKSELERKKNEFSSTLEDMTLQYERLKAQLDENETHAQLVNQERKWQHLEQNNFALSEYIKSKSLDYKPVSLRVDRKITQLNKQLQSLYTKGSIM